MIGNFEGAIDCSLKCGRVAEALLLAYSTSEMLFDSTAKGNTKKNIFKIFFNFIIINKFFFNLAFFVSSKDLFIKNVFKNIYEK